MSGQGKENLPVNETVTIFTEDELERFKIEAFRAGQNGRRKYQQSAAYILMLNTGIRTGEALGLINSDIDLDNRVMHVRRGVKEIYNREGTKATSGRSVNVGKLSLRHTFATRLVNGIKQADGTIRSLTPRQVADILGHSTSQITELYYVRKDTKRLSGLTNEFEL